MLAAFQRTITDERGDVVPGATVYFRSENGGGLASLFADRNGDVPLSNPVVADSEGFVRVFAPGAPYRVTAVKEGLVREWRYVPIGTAAEFDFGAVGNFPSAVRDALADRAAFDGEAEGFSVLITRDSSNSNQPTIYWKLSAGAADWSEGVTWGGPQGAPGAAANFDIALFVGRRPDPSEVVARYAFTANVVFPTGLAGSRASAGTAATGSPAFSLRRNGVEFGTCSFSGATGSFSSPSGANFVPGDVLTVVAPASVDATLEDISITLANQR